MVVATSSTPLENNHEKETNCEVSSSKGNAPLVRNTKEYPDENNILTDTHYICESSFLITESLQKGCDVMQMSNGDIIITELKTVIFQYRWDSKKGQMVRVQQFNRSKKSDNDK